MVTTNSLWNQLLPLSGALELKAGLAGTGPFTLTLATMDAIKNEEMRDINVSDTKKTDSTNHWVEQYKLNNNMPVSLGFRLF